MSQFLPFAFGGDGLISVARVHLPYVRYYQDLALGSPFGMLKATTDVLPLVELPSDGVVISGDGNAKAEYFSILKVTHKRGYCVGSLGVLPTWICPVLERILPWYCTDGIAAANLAQIVTTVVY